MKKIFMGLALATTIWTSMSAAKVEYTPGDINPTSFDAGISNNQMFVSMTFDASDMKLKSNQEVVVTPILTNGTESVVMEPFMIVGRNRYYYHLRNNDSAVAPMGVYRAGKDVSNIKYSATFPFQAWMEESEVVFNVDWRGCCNAPKGTFADVPVGIIDMKPHVYEADFVYITPQAEGVKTRQESGSAFIDFPVNKTVIYPDYRNNPVELLKIQETINKVRDDKDVTITSIGIHGYASPEGSYENNTRLAKGRTEALMNYVKTLYKFPSSVKFVTASTPEDWAGLKKYVEESNLPEKQGILNLINSDLSPDVKDARIKSDFPGDYAFLLQNVYPGLRHSDYVIEYNVREYSNPEEILAVMQVSPQKLSLSELFVAANSLEPGSDLYNEVFETAVRLFPNDEIAKLNAANSAMMRKDYVNAQKYLDKAGKSDEAVYARGVLKALQGDYASAVETLKKVRNLDKAASAISQLEAIMAAPETTVKLTGKK